MKTSLFLIIFSVFSNILLFSQEEQYQKGKFFIAPDFGLMLGSINNIEVSPAFGYYFTDRISAAAGFKYEFYSETRLYINQDPIKTSIYGPRAFLRIIVFKNMGKYLPIGMNTSLYGQAEFETVSLENKYYGLPGNVDSGRFWHDTPFIGAGIAQSVSERININAVALWDAGGSSVHLYSNPVIRFGIQFFIGKDYKGPGN